jgi:hypothetical protein
LIGNFGEQGQFSGWINAFNGGNNNDSLGPLRDATGKPITIDSPWALVFGTFLNSDADTRISRPGRTSRRTAYSVRSWRSRNSKMPKANSDLNCGPAARWRRADQSRFHPASVTDISKCNPGALNDQGFAA